MSWPEPNRESGHPSGPCGGSSWLAQSSYLQAYNYASTIRTKMFELMRRHIKRKGPEIHSREHLRRGQRHRQQQPFVRLQARGKGTGDGTKKKREKGKAKRKREKHGERKTFNKYMTPSVMTKAWLKARSPENIMASFKRAGLDPLDVRVPLARIQSSGT